MTGRRELLLAVSASLIVGCAIGLVAGVLFTRAVLFERSFRPPLGRPPFGRRGGPEGPPLRLLARRLELSREQEARVDSILRESRVQFDSLRAGTRAALERELTPEQRERWERINRRFFRSRDPRPPAPPEGP